MARGLLVGACLTARASLGLAQAPQVVPPEPPAPMPPAATLPKYLDRPMPAAEPPARMPPASTLPSMRGGNLGAEPPAPMPPATALPSYRSGKSLGE